MEAIQQHKNERIYNKVAQILTYFGFDADVQTSTDEDFPEEHEQSSIQQPIPEVPLQATPAPFQFQFTGHTSPANPQ